LSDIPAIAKVAHAKGARVIDDNTWATPLFHRSLDQGVDISHHIGLENVDDLKADLERGFAALKAAA
jgi:cysteine-S-conjugate beta-lyase